MKTTRAVKAAAKTAEDIHQQVYGPANEADPDAILDDLNDGVAEPTFTVVDSIAEPVLDPVVDPVVEPPLAPTDAELIEKAEHKYSVLQGIHRKLLEENNELRSRVGALESAPAPIAASPVKSEGLITDTDVEDYGSELISMVKRAAQEEMSPELSRLTSENEQLREQMSGVATTVSSRAKEDVYGTLATEVPTWEQINASDEYLFWLAQRDPFSGNRRHDLLTQAFEANDAARVVTFFKAFLNEDTAVTLTEPAVATATPVPAKIDLVSMAAPGKAQSPGRPSNQTDTRVYSRAEISAHYKAVQLGKFNGTPEDKVRIEKAFVKAANQGRVA